MLRSKIEPSLQRSTNIVLYLFQYDYYETDDVDYRNKYENIIGAYAIAYILEDGKLNPYIARIDKNRIERGKKAAMTQNIWNSDTRKMVIKTENFEIYGYDPTDSDQRHLKYTLKNDENFLKYVTKKLDERLAE